MGRCYGFRGGGSRGTRIVGIVLMVAGVLVLLLSIPSWLNDMAERADINFSGTLQEALKAKLNIG